jgi:transposase InsO family protein
VAHRSLRSISWSFSPFPLRGIDSDNGSEFINYHLHNYCKKRRIQVTRGRPYKKDDNAHIEQKNWTHVRRIFGGDRYDSRAVMNAMNDVYTQELRLMMNLYQPSVKLREKEWIGTRLRRRYEAPQTPVDRLIACPDFKTLLPVLQKLPALRQRLNPFTLSAAMETKLAHIERVRQAPYACQENIVPLQPHSSPWGGVCHETPHDQSKTSQG